MTFDDLYIFRKSRFSIGIERDSGRHYLSFPVFNGLGEYEEYYYLEQAQLDEIMAGLHRAEDIARELKKQQDDANLIVKPGAIRGRPD